jgi:hypothetical protein
VNFLLSIQIVSIVSILIPIIICFVVYKTAGYFSRLFFLFLCLGFITDVTMYSLSQIEKTGYLPLIFNFYSLIESLFFYWFIFHSTKSRTIKLILKLMLLVTPLFWVAFVFLFPSVFPTDDTSSQIFDTVYEIVVAFLAGFVILEKVETDYSVTTKSDFWILIGLFFYCFCTFFIMGFLNTFFSKNIWFLNNIINIITYGFYSIGLLKLRAR